MNTKKIIIEITLGFEKLKVNEIFRKNALKNIEKWLTDEQFKDYVPQLVHMVESKYWDYLLDSFYQIIPFGTGGRRGEVGIGPNRINPWTINSACQGHSQYLYKHYGKNAYSRGVVLTYDVRQFFTNKYFDDKLPNPVKNIKAKDFAKSAAQVYAANGLKVYFFEDVRTTPQLSFAIRFLKAVAGSMFSASHNPPEHNGQKVYDEFGGQLIPPEDEALVNEVTKNTESIKSISFETGLKSGLIEIIGKEVDLVYFEALKNISLSDARGIKIAYTPLHGCGIQNAYAILKYLDFDIQIDPMTGNPSGKFENVTFNIPNPEVEQSFDTPLKFAKKIKADILLSSDPDSDRIGVMAFHKNKWEFLNGNEIGIILTQYIIDKKLKKLEGQGIVIKTTVTTNLISVICKHYGVKIIGDLLVGFKYVGEVMNDLEKKGLIDNLLFGSEESHGYIAGNYVRDKDSAIAAVYLAELASELKKNNKTLVDYLYKIYSKYGYFRNYLTEIRLPGAEGKSQIDTIQKNLRETPPLSFGKFKIIKIEDYLNRKPIVSETDAISKNMIEFQCQPFGMVTSIKVTIRPSGTEPKIKMYFEIGSQPIPLEQVGQVKKTIEDIKDEFEKEVMKTCYKLIGINFPDRGFLLFWQLPLQLKMKYFSIEKDIINLKETKSDSLRKKQLDNLLGFLGSDPIEKVDKAFIAKYGSSINNYLNLK